MLARLRDEFGIGTRTITGEEEARLTFLGATSGRARGGGPVLVVDIGGGSTEFVVGEPGAEPDFHASTRAGSVRQTERHIKGDPPHPDQVADMADEVRAIITGDVPAEVRRSVERGIAVAGTATSLAAIDQELEPHDPEKVHGYQLELGACERMLALLAELSLERRRQVAGLHPDRAPTIVAGAVILIEAMRACGLEVVETRSSTPEQYTSLVRVTVNTRAGATSVGGVISDGRAYVVQIDDYELHLPPILREIWPAPLTAILRRDIGSGDSRITSAPPAVRATQAPSRHVPLPVLMGPLRSRPH